ncbi:MAG TPA: D-alanine--D-alanine ligase, partial [Candidatus Limnocylindria bacterium]|nr:D-alanine--D-alanine ligase [Candidatus Limnocylindria bacterium]
EVSVRSGRRVAEALRDAGLEVRVLDADAALLPSLAAERPDVVVPLLHGQAGEDGAVRDVLELLGISYVGSRPEACRGAFDKPAAKATLERAGVDVPGGVVLPHATFRELGAGAVLDALVHQLGLPLMVKPSRGGSALGASVVSTEAALPAAMVAAFAYADTALVERLVLGTEVAVSVVDLGAGPVALPGVEIVPDGGVYDYAARYTAGATEFFAPARLDAAVAQRCADVALTAHAGLGLRDLSRSDLIVDASGTPWFLEANVAPGMTETSLLPQAVGAAGLDLGTVCRALVERAAARGS